MDKAERMQEITQALHNLEASPLYRFRQDNNYQPVIGEGNLNARIMFIGEAPGAQEARTGRPFVGAAGRVLAGLLSTLGINRDDVYITNIVKDRPPDNRDPRIDEIELYTPFLLEQINIIQPEIIVTLGRFAMDYILQQFNMPQLGQRIGDLHGQTLTAQAPYGEIAVVPLYHPAAAFYNDDLESTMKEDIKALKPFVDGD